MPNRKPLSTACLLQPEILDSIARSSGLMTRSSCKFNATGFVLSLLGAATRGASSLNHIALGLAGFTPRAMSRQAMSQRFSPRSTEFLVGVIGAALAQRTTRRFAPLDHLPFRRILVEDSTVISMFKGNSGAFPNNGNGKTDTAGCKIDLVTDLLAGQAVAARFCPAREPDQALASDILEHCRQGDLILRDMGYFCLHALDDIDTRNAFWLSRLPATVGLRDRRGRTLREVLNAAEGNRIDIQVELGSRTPMSCRLVATRLSQAQVSANRRLRRKQGQRRGKTPSKEALLRDEWSLVVTNVPKDVLAAARVWSLYAHRWSIEIAFRAAKQSSNAKKSLGHKSSEHHLKALVLATALLAVLGMRVYARLRSAPQHTGAASLEKTCDAFADYVLRRSAHNLHEPFAPDRRHLAHDKRRRPTLWQSITRCLS